MLRSMCLALMFMIVMPVFSQEVVVYYYGQEVNTDYIESRREQGLANFCVQQIIESTLVTGTSHVFECFDSEKEAAENLINLKPWIEKLAAVTTDKQVSSSKLLLCSDRFNLYYNSLYTDFYGTLCNGEQFSNIPANGIWSVYRDGSPNSLTLYQLINFGGAGTSL